MLLDWFKTSNSPITYWAISFIEVLAFGYVSNFSFFFLFTLGKKKKELVRITVACSFAVQCVHDRHDKIVPCFCLEEAARSNCMRSGFTSSVKLWEDITIRPQRCQECGYIYKSLSSFKLFYIAKLVINSDIERCQTLEHSKITNTPQKYYFTFGFLSVLTPEQRWLKVDRKSTVFGRSTFPQKPKQQVDKT